MPRCSLVVGTRQILLFDLHIVQKCFRSPPSLNLSGHLCAPSFVQRQPRHTFGNVVRRSLLLPLDSHGQRPILCSVLGLCFATQKAQILTPFLLPGGRQSVLSLAVRPVSGHLRRPNLPPRPPPPRPPPPPRLLPCPLVLSAPAPTTVAAGPARISALLNRGFFGSLFLPRGPSVLDMRLYSLNLVAI